MIMEEFLKHVKEVAGKFKSIDKKPIKLIGNLDSDGITATSILIKAFLRENLKFSVSVIKQITPKIVSELKHEPYDTIVFTDLGSGYLTQLEEHLSNKTIFILDHHIPDKKETKFHHVNPHMFMIDGGKEISAAGVSYLFAKFLNPNNIDLAYLAIIGAIGDVQENQGFEKLNQYILEDALLSKKVEVKTGLRLYGMQTKPLHKVLEYSTNPYIPNVTGSETGAILFLQELGIPVQENGKFRKFTNLTEEEIKKIVTAIILRRMGSESNPEDIFGPIYLLQGEDDESPTKDLREFSTLINCCGRMGKPTWGVGTCLNEKYSKEKAIELLNEYRREIINALNWYYNNKSDKSKVIEGSGYVILNAEDYIRETIIGTTISIIAKSNIYPEGTIIFGLAHSLDVETKVSTRICGFGKHDTDLRSIIKEILKKTGGEGGGHHMAAGAVISQDKESLFIETAKELLDTIEVKA